MNLSCALRVVAEALGGRESPASALRIALLCCAHSALNVGFSLHFRVFAMNSEDQVPAAQAPTFGRKPHTGSCPRPFRAHPDSRSDAQIDPLRTRKKGRLQRVLRCVV
jgi:hypothetical protein